MEEPKSPGALLSLARLVVQNWKILLTIQIAVGVIMVIILLLLKPWYRSTATVVIQNTQQGGILSALSNSLPIGIDLLGNQNDAQHYLAFINTQRMLDSVNNKFDMQKVYGLKYIDQVYKAISNNLHTVDNNNGTFSISFDYKNNPRRAAEIVNYIYKVLYEIALEVNRAQALDYSTYIANYYRETSTKLDSTRHRFAHFQKNTGLYDLQDQLPVFINSIANLESQKMQYEIQLDYLKRVKQNSTVNLNAIKTQIKSIDSQISDLKRNNRYSNVALDTLPNLAIPYLEMSQKIMTGEKVVAYLRLQYEQALLDEQKKSADIYLLDPAKPADRKFKPKRSSILILVMSLVFVLSIIYLKGTDYYHENRSYILNQ